MNDWFFEKLVIIWGGKSRMILKQRKYKEYTRNEISLRNDDVFK